jgi:hypothetical protein
VLSAVVVRPASLACVLMLKEVCRLGMRDFSFVL